MFLVVQLHRQQTSRKQHVVTDLEKKLSFVSKKNITIENHKKNTLSPRQTPPKTVSKTKIPKIQPYIHKNPKIPGKHQQKNTKKKILKLKKLYQTSSPSEVRKKNNQKLQKKKNLKKGVKLKKPYQMCSPSEVAEERK